MRVRAEVAWYVVFTLVLGVPTALFAYFGEPQGGLLFGALYVFSIVWLRVFAIVLGDSYLEFHTPFGRRQRIAYSEIELLRHGRAHKHKGYILEVLPKTLSNRNAFVINSKIFSRKGLAMVFETVGRFAKVEDTVFSEPVIKRVEQDSRAGDLPQRTRVEHGLLPPTQWIRS